MTSPGPAHQPAAVHAERATPQHADCHLLSGQGGSPGKWRSNGAGWPGAWAAGLAALRGPGSPPPDGWLPVLTCHARAGCRPHGTRPLPAAAAAIERAGEIRCP